MSTKTIHTGEILFVKCVKDGIPNRDPLRESDARRLFGPEDGRISLSDVSIKRDVRDFVLARYPEGGPNKDRFVFVRKEFSEDGSVLLGRDGLAQAILERVRKDRPQAPPPAVPQESAKPAKKGKGKTAEGGENDETDLLAAAFDMRAFGAVFSVKGKSFNRVGPVQFGWAHSLHPVETKYVQGTVCMPSKDAPPPREPTSEKRPGDDKEEKGKTQGTIWTMYQLPFAVFAMPGVVSGPIAATTGLTPSDMDTVLEGLWKGTLARQARGRGIQQPLFLLHVEYKDPFFRVGYLEEGVRLLPGRDTSGRESWLGGQAPTNVGEIQLDVATLSKTLADHAGQVARTRVWTDPRLRLVGALTAERGSWSEGA
jgi:CRISPR-associated protein Csh2